MLSLSVGVIGFMFVFTYLPQVAVLAVVNGPREFLSFFFYCVVHGLSLRTCGLPIYASVLRSIILEIYQKREY